MEFEATTRDMPATAYKLYHLQKWKGLSAIVALSVILFSIVIASMLIGSADIPLIAVINLLLPGIPFPEIPAIDTLNASIIIFSIRLPRILMAGLVGAALAVAGAAYQGMFHNPLADPYLTGISQGAALGAVIGFLLPGNMTASLIPFLAFLGAILCVFAVYSIARVGKTVPLTTLILAGVAVGAFLASITSYLTIIAGDRVHGIIFWLLGTFSLADWWRVTIIAPYILVGIVIICLYARPLNVMQLDEEQARQLGINVERVKLILLAAATLATGAAVCFCGIIGFVGIIIPHLIRILFGPDHRLLLPLSVLAGASFLILADTISRSIMSPSEIPVGIITALIGVPFFLYILNSRKKAVF